jgi:hypothetical protein
MAPLIPNTQVIKVNPGSFSLNSETDSSPQAASALLLERVGLGKLLDLKDVFLRDLGEAIEVAIAADGKIQIPSGTEGFVVVDYLAGDPRAIKFDTLKGAVAEFCTRIGSQHEGQVTSGGDGGLTFMGKGIGGARHISVLAA